MIRHLAINSFSENNSPKLKTIATDKVDEGEDLNYLSGCNSIVYIVDITNDYLDCLTKLCALALKLKAYRQIVPLEVFLHKADVFGEHERQGKSIKEY
jgi:hypothetical protein